MTMGDYQQTGSTATPLYPLFLRVQGRRVLVAGAGAVAERKVETLLKYGADVVVVAPEATARISALAADGTITLIPRTFVPGDCNGATLVISAVGNEAVDEAICADAHTCGALVNIVDVPPLCDFYVPSVIDRGRLQIAISTCGCAPLVARQLRQRLETDFSPVWDDYLELLGKVRALVLQRVPGGEAAHKPLLQQLAAMGLLERLERGEVLEAEALYQELCEPVQVQV
jgi:precorrin-2 dehydrogenase/sirohydrochlorin ferrochelatase